MTEFDLLSESLPVLLLDVGAGALAVLPDLVVEFGIFAYLFGDHGPAEGVRQVLGEPLNHVEGVPVFPAQALQEVGGSYSVSIASHPFSLVFISIPDWGRRRKKVGYTIRCVWRFEIKRRI